MCESKDKNEKFLDYLYGVFEEAELGSVEDTESSLRENGIDPDQLVKEGLDIVKRCSAQQRLVQARARFNSLQAIFEDVRSGIVSQANELRVKIAESMVGSRDAAALATFYRKLAKFDDADLLSIGEDTQIINLWEEMESDIEAKN